MKLFLASEAYLVLELFEREFFSLKNKRVAFIANAADVYSNKYFIQRDKAEFRKRGAKVIGIDLRKLKNNELFKKLSEFDIICIGGGNAFYLLEKMKESGFDKIIRKILTKDVVYIGSSAGSCITAPDITLISDLDNPSCAKSLNSYKSLSLINELLLPHSNTKKYGPICRRILNDNPKEKLRLLSDNQTLIVKNEKKYFVTI